MAVDTWQVEVIDREGEVRMTSPNHQITHSSFAPEQEREHALQQIRVIGQQLEQ